MLSIIAIVCVLAYTVFLSVVLRGISRGKFVYLLIYLVAFLPIYTVFLSFTYAYLEIEILTKLIQYSKEIVILYALSIWSFGYSKGLASRPWQLSVLDRLFLGFLSLAAIFVVLPIGEAGFVDKAIYFKNILLFCLAYLFGRQINLKFEEWKTIFKIVFAYTAAAFLLVLIEKLSSTHFHSYIGYAKYNSDMLNLDPEGSFGLRWTFQAQGMQPRYGAFFSNPLEFSASMLISVAAAIIYLLSMRFNTNRLKYLYILGFCVCCVLLAYSRATMGAIFVTLIFMAFLFRYYKILTGAALGLVLLSLYVWFLAPEETRYFVEDTLMFQNSSSLSHVVEWVEGIDSMVQNPQGIGLAMSGNAGGVDDEIKISGENQFLIFGVQLGVIGLILYIFMIFYAIRHSWLAFRRAGSREEQVIPFVAASVKFGLLMPLFTANAETYLYLSLVSWWMVGHSQSVYQRLRERPKTSISANTLVKGIGS